MIRDALWAAANHARTTAALVDTHRTQAEADIYQIRQLLDQCLRVAPAALEEGGLTIERWELIQNTIEQVDSSLVPEKEMRLRISEKLEQSADVAEA